MHALKCSALALLGLTVMVMSPLVKGNAQSVNASTQACLPTATLEQFPAAFDAAISGPGNKDRTCLRQLLMPDARIVLTVRVAEGVLAPHSIGVEDWITAVSKRGADSLFEREVKVSSDTFDRIAHLWCTYELRGTPDGKATSRGLVSIEVVFDAQTKSWKIAEVSWQPERPDGQKIPAKYLP